MSFVFRNIVCDWRLDISHLRNKDGSRQKTPILSMFGATSSGQKCCVHIHDYLPYFYVKSFHQDPNADKLLLFKKSLDEAISISLNKTTNHSDAKWNSGSAPSSRYVHDIESVMLMACDLLQNGAVFNQQFQPYEVHLPYILKFFIDYQIYGMDLVEIKKDCFKFRRPAGINCLFVLSLFAPSNVQTISSCELELDASVCDICLKRRSSQDSITTDNELHNPGLQFIWNEERERHTAKRSTETFVTSYLMADNSQDRFIQPRQRESMYREMLAEKIANLPRADDSYVENSSPNIATASHTATGSSDTLEDDVTSTLPDSNETIVDMSVIESLISSERHISETEDRDEYSSQKSAASEKGNDSFLDLLEQMMDAGEAAEAGDVVNHNLAEPSTSCGAGPTDMHNTSMDAENADEVDDDKDTLEMTQVAPHSDNESDEDQLPSTSYPAFFDPTEGIDQLDGASKRGGESSQKRSKPTTRAAKMSKKSSNKPSASSTCATGDKFLQLTLPVLPGQRVESASSSSVSGNSQSKPSNFSRNNPVASGVRVECQGREQILSAIAAAEDDDSDCMIIEVDTAPSLSSRNTIKSATLQSSAECSEAISRKRKVTASAKTKEVHSRTKKIPRTNQHNVSKPSTSDNFSFLTDNCSTAETLRRIEIKSSELPTQSEVVRWCSENNSLPSTSIEEHISCTSTRHTTTTSRRLPRRKLPQRSEEQEMEDLLQSHRQSKEHNVWSAYFTPSDVASTSCNERLAVKIFSLRCDQGPPMSSDVRQWLDERKSNATNSGNRVIPQTSSRSSSIPSINLLRNETQLEGASLRSSFGFDVTYTNMQDLQLSNEKLNVVVMSLELHAHCCGNLSPDPTINPICVISCTIFDEGRDKHIDYLFQVETSPEADDQMEAGHNALHVPKTSNLCLVKTELEMINNVLDIVKEHNPDILVGYEIQMQSWGYLLERASSLNLNLCRLISRLPGNIRDGSRFSNTDDWWAMSDMRVTGRIVLNLWRVMKHEIAVTSYTAENMAFNVLRKRIPQLDYVEQTRLCSSPKHTSGRWQVLDYISKRSRINIDLIMNCDIIGRTAEMAKVFGIQFYDVLTRGSQFRVESMLFRMTKTNNYVGVSPSSRLRTTMNAPECIPLTMEPESGFYTDPVIVLDFQSLYPSMMIAYNYCYSTCLGKVSRLDSANPVIEFGCHKLAVPLHLIKKLFGDIHISAAGVAFVRRSFRVGILSRMLEEILNTRFLVKKVMKQTPASNKSLLKLLDARQLGLKYIANFTYGYTSANFSGRMPCVEVADSIVHQGRETLEKAIEMVNSNPTWNGRVIYGDTDSMFVLLPGRSKSEAFAIGKEMAELVTRAFPKPVKLKFEKVYFPCVLMSKKRYVGYSYESEDQAEPTFDAKGIETVRRDTCDAVSKIMEKSLRILFETKSVPAVRSYVERQLNRVRFGSVNLREFIFAKEFRGRSGYKPDACVPSLTIARRRMVVDRRSEPRIGERVPYVIVCGPPGATLISCVRDPKAVASLASTERLNYTYYITNHILPTLARVFSLIDENVFNWYRSMRLVSMAHRQSSFSGNQGPNASVRPKHSAKQRTLSQFFYTAACLGCGNLTTRHGLCSECCSIPPYPTHASINLSQRLKSTERKLSYAHKICSSCLGVNEARFRKGFPTNAAGLSCSSIDCPMFFKYHQLLRQSTNHIDVRSALEDLDW